MLETDILIIGGGPAGSTVAKYLSIAHVDNVLVQRNFDFRKPCGGGVRMDSFDEFEIDKALIKKRVNEITLVYKSKKIEIDVTKTPLAIVDRVEFDTALRNAAREKGTKLYEAAFVSLERFDTHVISKIKLNGEYVEIKSNYVIAADGVNSKIRKLVNGDEVSSLLTHYTDLTSKSYDSCQFHFGEEVAKRHYAWAFPHANGSNVGTVADDEDCLAKLKINLDVSEETKNFGYKIPKFENNVFYKERVFFVGDSASQVLPFTYEGIHYAMSSAKILSEIVIQKREPIEYEKEWNKKHQKRFSSLLKLQKVFLYNDFMIAVMMKLYESKYIQRQMVSFWLGDRDLDVNLAFFLRMFKRVIKIKQEVK